MFLHEGLTKPHIGKRSGSIMMWLPNCPWPYFMSETNCLLVLVLLVFQKLVKMKLVKLWLNGQPNERNNRPVFTSVIKKRGGVHAPPPTTSVIQKRGGGGAMFSNTHLL